MDELIELVINSFYDHWTKVAIGAGLMAAGWLFGRYRAQQSWEKKEFFGRINFSLNSIDNGKLKIRTIMEKSCDEVFLNQVAVTQLLAAAQETTAKDPIIPLGDGDYWFFLNAALNEVSEKFSSGFIHRDIGQSVNSHLYLLCLTNEVDGSIRTRKLRAMLILKKTLEELPEEMPELESENHQTRWRTLEWMAQEYREDPKRFITVEIVV